MTRLHSYILFLGLLALVFTASGQYTPHFRTSKKEVVKIPKDIPYTFGYLEVPENREKPNGVTIKLPVYIFKSRSQSPPKDPIIYTVGGPGNSTMSSAPYARYYQYLDDRDFIFFEQRGTYYAQPNLDCPELAEAMHQQWIERLTGSGNSSEEEYQKAIMDCKERHSGKGVDLSAYHSDAIAADIHDLKIALGLDQYNLLTVSYSTKIAQILMRDYPEEVRSVVMDSPLPLEASYDEESTQNLFDVYHEIFDRCKNDESCGATYPNLENRYYAFLEALNDKPIELSIKVSKKPVTLRLKGRDLFPLLADISYPQVYEVPFLVNQIISGDYTRLEELFSAALNSQPDGIGLGMRLSVWCAEEFPFTNQSVIADETAKYPAITGLEPSVFDYETCTTWSVTPLPEKANQAVVSDIPVLLISGSVDNETPSRWARQMLPNLPSGHHIVFPSWRHTPTTYWSNPCAMQMANQFFNNPSEMPEAACFDEIKWTSFKVK